MDKFNDFSKILWGNLICVFTIIMCLTTHETWWLSGFIIGGIFFGIKTLGTVAKMYSAAAMGGASNDSKKENGEVKAPDIPLS